MHNEKTLHNMSIKKYLILRLVPNGFSEKERNTVFPQCFHTGYSSKLEY